MSLQVLFVDDEPNVLDGLRRALHRCRSEWNMRFAPSGAAALAALAQAPADVVVSDMRMPGMNGDELLSEVHRRHPQTVRIVLTGDCTREAMTRVSALAHRILSKPCDPEELKAAVRQVAVVQGLAVGPRLTAAIGRLRGVPSKPDLYTEIASALADPNRSLSELGRICARDVGVSAKLIQLANSALVGGGRPVVRAADAVSRIGVELTQALVLAEGVLSQFDPRSIAPFTVGDVWSDGHAVAALAVQIARLEAPGAAWLALVPGAGMFHDIGRLVLAGTDPKAYVTVLNRVRSGGATVPDAERHVFGVTHADVGAYLLGLWGLPAALVEAVAWHHTPSTDRTGRFGLVSAVHAAAAIVDPSGGGPDMSYLERIGAADRFQVWSALAPGALAAGTIGGGAP